MHFLPFCCNFHQFQAISRNLSHSKKFTLLEIFPEMFSHFEAISRQFQLFAALSRHYRVVSVMSIPSTHFQPIPAISQSFQGIYIPFKPIPATHSFSNYVQLFQSVLVISCHFQPFSGNFNQFQAILAISSYFKATPVISNTFQP